MCHSLPLQSILIAFQQAMNSSYSSPLCSGTAPALSNCMPVLLLDDETSIVLPNGTLPSANATQLNQTSLWGPNGLQTSYNLTAWIGNTTAYMYCDLQDRGPQYLGVCMDMPVNCITTTSDSVPYNCTTIPGNATIAGNLSDTSYRANCEAPCDAQLDCNAICQCYGACSATQVGASALARAPVQ